MRILCGTDIVELARIDRSLNKSGPAFISRCFTEEEAAYCNSLSGSRRIESFGGRFAAKEAASKALGTGIMNEGVTLSDIEIIRSEEGAPELILHGRALDRANELGVVSMSVSISHDGGFAVAYCCMLAG